MKFGNALTQTTTGEITVLEIGRDTSLVQRVAGEELLLCKVFSLGVVGLVGQCLIHEPPWPIVLEQAIELTEEAVMPLAAQFADTTRLILQGLGTTLIANTLTASGLSLTVHPRPGGGYFQSIGCRQSGATGEPGKATDGGTLFWRTTDIEGVHAPPALCGGHSSIKRS